MICIAAVYIKCVNREGERLMFERLCGYRLRKCDVKLHRRNCDGKNVTDKWWNFINTKNSIYVDQRYYYTWKIEWECTCMGARWGQISLKANGSNCLWKWLLVKTSFDIIISWKANGSNCLCNRLVVLPFCLSTNHMSLLWKRDWRNLILQGTATTGLDRNLLFVLDNSECSMFSPALKTLICIKRWKIRDKRKKRQKLSTGVKGFNCIQMAGS